MRRSVDTERRFHQFTVNGSADMKSPSSSLDQMQHGVAQNSDSTFLTRRRFLQATSLPVAWRAMTSSSFSCFESSLSSASEGFVHRAYNGWITDLASLPDPRAEWPSMRLDEPLLADYRETFALMKRLGFNEIVIWGLYVSNNWPLELKSAVTMERGRLVERLIKSGHDHGIKVISGLGTYSWGFKEIIRANPKLNGGNPNAMCASEPASHEWMRRIVDFEFERFPIDGVSMQSADLGRCDCARCARLGDAAYHAALISRTAEYIRSKWPNRIVGMSNWGVSFSNPRDRETFARMSHGLDYIIDQNNSVHAGGEEYQQEFIRALACPFGTTGGLVVEPPQHWARDRWFLPTCRHVHEHLLELSAQGGRAVEFFYHILANPSSELTFQVAGKTLADPQEPLEKQLAVALEELYQPGTTGVRDGLVKFFLAAEDAYFQSPGKGDCGTISLEPLVSSEGGPPIYLRDRLSREHQIAYARNLGKLTAEFKKLQPDLRSVRRANRVMACLKNVQADLAALL